MLSTPAPAAAPPMGGGGFGGLIDTGAPVSGGGAGGLNDLFSIQSALPGSGFVAPPTVRIVWHVQTNPAKLQEKAM